MKTNIIHYALNILIKINTAVHRIPNYIFLIEKQLTNSPINTSVEVRTRVCTCTDVSKHTNRMQEAEKCSTSQGIFCNQTVPVPLCMCALGSG